MLKARQKARKWQDKEGVARYTTEMDSDSMQMPDHREMGSGTLSSDDGYGDSHASHTSGSDRGLYIWSNSGFNSLYVNRCQLPRKQTTWCRIAAAKRDSVSRPRPYA